MNEPRALPCSECGAPLDSASEAGVCASCAFGLALEISGGLAEEPDSGAGSVAPPEIPGFELRELLGRGGMGTVWKAEQREPVRRDVAIKLVRAGLDSGEVAARFATERQALAMMDHPHVARFFDAGTTVDGQPYFVMEHVPGSPITEFCNERRMPLEDRVRLFADVCETVHHAHQKGIIHRDLKPSNILVLERDGRPEPKVIDFGIAKATRPKIFDRTQLTRGDQLLGTPEYMSPEQMARGESDVDVRSDVYSLGAVLYELLSGSCPFDRSTLSSGGLEEMLRTVRDVDAPTPSERVTTLGDSGAETARFRATEPATLVSRLRGDLDWITMKALAKEPDRRYESAAAFAEDQRRYLRYDPVHAGPPGAAYRARKFVRRHPVAVASGAVLFLSLVIFAVGTAFQARRIARERDRANEQAAVSRQVTDFLVELFRVSDPTESRGNEVTAREILDRGAARIREEITDPAVRAELLGEMGEVYGNLGLGRESEALLREATALHAQTFGLEDPRTLELMGVLASKYHGARAESVMVVALEGWRALVGEEDPHFLDALHNLALIHREQDRMTEAEAEFVHVLEERRRRGEEDEPAAMAAMSNLGVLYTRTSQYDKAEPLLLEAVARRRRVLGEDHPRTLLAMSALGDLYQWQGRLEEAESLLAETAERQRRVLGEAHPDYWLTLDRQVQIAWWREDWEQARKGFSRILELRTEALGPEHPHTLIAMHNLSSVLNAQGESAAAESLLLKTWEIRKRVIGERHRHTLGTLVALSLTAIKRGDRELGLERLREAVRLGLDDPEILTNDIFVTLREDPEFRELIEEVERHVKKKEGS